MARFSKTNSEKDLISKEFKEIKERYNEQIKDLENKLKELEAEYETIKANENAALDSNETTFLEVSDALRRNEDLQKFYGYRLNKLKGKIFTDLQKKNLTSRINKEVKAIEEEALKDIVPLLMKAQAKAESTRLEQKALLEMKAKINGAEMVEMPSIRINSIAGAFSSYFYNNLFKEFGEGQ